MYPKEFRHLPNSQPSRRDMLKLSAGTFVEMLGRRFPFRSFLPQDAGAVSCADPSNPIVAENCLPGSSDWIVTNLLNDIEGFAYPTSLSQGETVDFYVNTPGELFTIQIYRSGYYGGTGARLMQTIGDLEGKKQPDAHQKLYTTGLTSCANWSSSYSLQIPDSWISGIYFAKLIRNDTGGENYMLFVVREDARDSEVLYQQSLFTYHAYNNYGGKSIYDFNSGFRNTDTKNPRGAKVSLFRPYMGAMGFEDNANNNYFRVEYPMVRWLEQQGYDVTYSTNLDTHHSGLPSNPNRLLDHKIFLSVGHDEYWTQEMDDAISEARDAGVHIGVFSANTSYWRVRLEDDPWSGEPDSVIVCYKSTESGPPDPSGHPTGTFRDPEGVNDPENNLVGVMYIGDNDLLYFHMRVDAEHGKDRIYRHTDLQTMPDDSYALIGKELFGWEWDAVVDNGRTPDNLTVVAETPTYGFLLQDAGESDNGTSNTALANTARYTASSGAIVFASGTIQWSFGLGARGTEVIDPDPYIQQITYNVLADMGIQPATPSNSIILDGQDGRIESDPDFFLTSSSPRPQVTNIQLAHPGRIAYRGRSAEFKWETDVETKGQVWVQDSKKHFVISRLSTAQSRNHSAGVQIRPGSNFYYQIVALDERGQMTVTDSVEFKTPDNLMYRVGELLYGDRYARSNPYVLLAAPLLVVPLALVALWRLYLLINRRIL